MTIIITESKTFDTLEESPMSYAILTDGMRVFQGIIIDRRQIEGLTVPKNCPSGRWMEVDLPVYRSLAPCMTGGGPD